MGLLNTLGKVVTIATTVIGAAQEIDKIRNKDKKNS